MRYLILGGKQRKIKDREHYQEWMGYSEAVALLYDSTTNRVSKAFRYLTPLENRPEIDQASILFKSGSVQGNQLLACTQTEVLLCNINSYEMLNTISLPCFNDVHHAQHSSDGNILVVSTGLDTVFKVSPQGHVIDHWEASEFEVWKRFDATTDYRKVPTTKPHTNHPNYCFEYRGDIWATRFLNKDAINLRTRETLNISIGHPHDGLVMGDKILFTTVDSKLIRAFPERHSIESIDLGRILNSEHEPGWCRGLCHVADNVFIVGFSRMRTTRFNDYLLWLKRKVKPKGHPRSLPTRLAIFDVHKEELLQEVNLEPHGMHAVFSIHSIPET